MIWWQCDIWNINIPIAWKEDTWHLWTMASSIILYSSIASLSIHHFDCNSVVWIFIFHLEIEDLLLSQATKSNEHSTDFIPFLFLLSHISDQMKSTNYSVCSECILVAFFVPLSDFTDSSIMSHTQFLCKYCCAVQHHRATIHLGFFFFFWLVYSSEHFSVIIGDIRKIYPIQNLIITGNCQIRYNIFWKLSGAIKWLLFSRCMDAQSMYWSYKLFYTRFCVLCDDDDDDDDPDDDDDWFCCFIFNSIWK